MKQVGTCCFVNWHFVVLWNTKTLSKWFHNVINHFVMQQMPIDRWNKFELVVLSIETLFCYEIPRFLTKWFHNVIYHCVMQQMPIDRWNKFQLVVLLIPRLYQSDFIMLWNIYMLWYTIQLIQVQSWLQVQNLVCNVFHNIM